MLQGHGLPLDRRRYLLGREEDGRLGLQPSVEVRTQLPEESLIWVSAPEQGIEHRPLRPASAAAGSIRLGAMTGRRTRFESQPMVRSKRCSIRVSTAVTMALWALAALGERGAQC